MTHSRLHNAFHIKTIKVCDRVAVFVLYFEQIFGHKLTIRAYKP